ncbi:Crp/Fnr family transcriptional regulator [Actinoplanes lobatus]|uniref:Crp/Fnr family transcriptional regulator n=1 Tax=Actinoplanes lobatus TaxID=113568 RepID=A0A7W7MKT3_9ACTN|nr:ThuA domain-containing protein [Actinoplanes lobatus]MBB4754024.1 type 1 glutamine amidotransferase [Actinoplanes lobatus]GGN76482.1 Crp/Fnr family transcriptional regulator [Actinoplanes lobatus]GIE40919.1 Crp/Fnr family transcriptional regulator [Actinoplanes lobatus]
MPPRVLLFTRTTGFRHDSIPSAVTALTGRDDLRVTASEDPADVAACDRFDAVVFVSTSGDVLGERARDALRSFVEGGRGVAGVHAATTTEPSWDWWPDLLGARFAGHPEGVQPATVDVVPTGHPSTAHLPPAWHFTDEWYAFSDVRPGSTLLLGVDESTYAPGEFGMPSPHPQAWFRQVGAGRSWYTGLGHREEAWSDHLFLTHVVNGVRWTAE